MMPAETGPVISHSDDELLLATAQDLVNTFFQQVRGAEPPPQALPARSQLQSLAGYAANHSARQVLEEFIRHQHDRARRAIQAAEAERKRSRLKDELAAAFWQQLDQVIDTGRLNDWVERDLPSASQRPEPGSANMNQLLAAFNRARKQRDELKQARLNAALPLFIRHLVCHYYYRLKEAELARAVPAAAEEEESS